MMRKLLISFFTLFLLSPVWADVPTHRVNGVDVPFTAEEIAEDQADKARHAAEVAQPKPPTLVEMVEALMAEKEGDPGKLADVIQKRDAAKNAEPE